MSTALIAFASQPKPDICTLERNGRRMASGFSMSIACMRMILGMTGAMFVSVDLTAPNILY